MKYVLGTLELPEGFHHYFKVNTKEVLSTFPFLKRQRINKAFRTNKPSLNALNTMMEYWAKVYSATLNELNLKPSPAELEGWFAEVFYLMMKEQGCTKEDFQDLLELINLAPVEKKDVQPTA